MLLQESHLLLKILQKLLIELHSLPERDRNSASHQKNQAEQDVFFDLIANGTYLEEEFAKVVESMMEFHGGF